MDFAITRPMSRRRKRNTSTSGTTRDSRQSSSSTTTENANDGTIRDENSNTSGIPPSPQQEFFSLEDIFWKNKKPKVKKHERRQSEKDETVEDKKQNATIDSNNSKKKMYNSSLMTNHHPPDLPLGQNKNNTSLAKEQGQAKKMSSSFEQGSLARSSVKASSSPSNPFLLGPLSRERCERIEGQHRQINIKCGNIRAIPHTALLWNILPSGKQNYNSMEEQQQHDQSQFFSRRRDTGSGNYDEVSQVRGLKRPRWTPLRYHHFFHSRDYTSTSIKTSNTNNKDVNNNISENIYIDSRVPNHSIQNEYETTKTRTQTQKLYNNNKLELSSQGLSPIPRECTVLCQSTKLECFALGDTAGYITLYNTNTLSSFARIETPSSLIHLEVTRKTSTSGMEQQQQGTTTMTSTGDTSSNIFQKSNHTLNSKPDASHLYNVVPPKYSTTFRKGTCDYRERKDLSNVSARSVYSIEQLCFVPIRRRKRQGQEQHKDESFVEGIAYSTKQMIELLYLSEHISYCPLWRLDLCQPRVATSTGIVSTTGGSNLYNSYVLNMDACSSTGRLCISFEDYYGSSPLAIVDTTLAPEDDSTRSRATVNHIPPSPTSICHVQPYLTSRLENGEDTKHITPFNLGPRAYGVWSVAEENYIIAVVSTIEDPSDDRDDGKMNNDDNAFTTSSGFIIKQELIIFDSAKSTDFSRKIDETCSKVISRVTLPTRKRAGGTLTTESISQSKPDGHLIAVASTGGGIRVYYLSTKTNHINLSLFGVFGENMKVHGQTVLWNQVVVFRTTDIIDKETHTDEVAYRILRAERTSQRLDNNKTTNNTKKNYHGTSRTLIMGLSHPFQEPTESRDIIYVWDLSDHTTDEAIHDMFRSEQDNNDHEPAAVGAAATAVETLPKLNVPLPTFTIAAPSTSSSLLSTTSGGVGSSNIKPSTRGIQSLLVLDSMLPSSSKTFGCRMIVTTHGVGECFVLQRNLHTLWAGAMYNPEFICVDNNVEYIEDEDEIDFNVDDLILHRSSRSQMIRSLEESKHSSSNIEEEIDVCTYNHNDEEETGCKVNATSIVFKCEPEWFLGGNARVRKENEIPGTSTGITTGPIILGGNSNSVLSRLGFQNVLTEHLNKVSSLRNNHKKRTGLIRPDSPDSITKANTSTSIRSSSSSSRPSISSLLSSSVKKSLQDEMMSMEEIWPCRPDIDHQNITNMQSSDVVEGNSGEVRDKRCCLACYGRSTIHSCGIRFIPIDTDAIARAREKKEKQEAETQKKFKIEKRREGERKRREEKKKKRAMMLQQEKKNSEVTSSITKINQLQKEETFHVGGNEMENTNEVIGNGLTDLSNSIELTEYQVQSTSSTSNGDKESYIVHTTLDADDTPSVVFPL